MDFNFEKNKLYSYLGKPLVEDLKKYNAYIAGGTLTSLFCNREINDIDVYFRSEDDLIRFLEEIWENGKYVVSNTNKATLLVYDNLNLQLIHYHYYETPQDIFKTFDFTACMGVYDFKSEEFILHNDFLKHNSQRILRFNSETSYPIVSLLRVQKYEGKGYYISKTEFIRIILTCMALEINSYEELKEQIGGLYGLDMSKLFKDIEDSDNEKFDLHKAIDAIANITLSDDYFKEPTPVHFGNLDDLIDTIMKTPFKAVKLNDQIYRIMADNSLKPTSNEELAQLISSKEYINELKVYKFVHKHDNGDLRSFYNSLFKYDIRKEVSAFTDDRNNGKLYFKYKNNINKSNYFGEKEGVLIEALISEEDVKLIDEDSILVKKAFITRVVPESEWKEWVNI